MVTFRDRKGRVLQGRAEGMADVAWWDRLPAWEKKSAVMAGNEGRRTFSI
jgi:hypothetical protein